MTADAVNGPVIMIEVDPHPRLDARAFTTRFSASLGVLSTPDDGRAPLVLDSLAPPASDERVREAIRKLLRVGGFKPSGRSKPASEYLLRAAAQGELVPINLAVDVCNFASLHTGVPISVVDLDKLEPPLRIAVAGAGEEYVFNASGQVMAIAGLICLYDAAGACANAVKDSQRTKTAASTQRTLTVLWSSRELPGRVDELARWYRGLLTATGAETESVAVVQREPGVP